MQRVAEEAPAPPAQSRRHIISVVAGAGDAADVADRIRAIARGGPVFVLRQAGTSDDDDGRADGTLSLDPATGELRLARMAAEADATVRQDAVLAGFPDLWMTEAQHGETREALRKGGSLLVVVAHTEEAGRALLRNMLPASRHRVRLHEFSARWADAR